MQRLSSLDKQVQQLAERVQYSEIVGLLRCFRGIDTLTAITVLTEIFEFGRFDSPRALMCYLGLVPSEHSSGDRRRSGSITKAGNKRVRRLLIESSWHYRHRPSVGRELKRRRDGQPQWAINIADRAMARLHRRYRQLLARGKVPNKVVVALARFTAVEGTSGDEEHQCRLCPNTPGQSTDIRLIHRRSRLHRNLLKKQ